MKYNVFGSDYYTMDEAKREIALRLSFAANTDEGPIPEKIELAGDVEFWRLMKKHIDSFLHTKDLENSGNKMPL